MIAFARHVGLTLGLFLVVTGGSCGNTNRPQDGAAPRVEFDALEEASLVWLIEGTEGLAGSPDVYEVQIALRGDGAPALPLRRQGRLPASGQLLAIDGLPIGAEVIVSADLFKGGYIESKRTHRCLQAQPDAVILSRDTPASVTLACTPVAGAQGPAEVFLETARMDLRLATATADGLVAQRRWESGAQFAATDADGRRLTLVSTGSSLTIHVGGDVSYETRGTPGVMGRLLAGEEVAVTRSLGRDREALPMQATLKLSSEVLLAGMDRGTPRFLLPIALESAPSQQGRQVVSVRGVFQEERLGSEFTLVSYNVENLFDQVDEDRNQGYGDYRLAPNTLGQSSNYGELVTFEGRQVTFTDVKIAGIRKVLEGIKVGGPEIVALQEVESLASVTALFNAVRDLGYVEGAFSGFIDGEAPNAIGLGLLTKFPVTEKKLIPVPYPDSATRRDEPIRPLWRVTLNVYGQRFVVYNNHWRSKGSPESLRLAAAQALEADLAALLAVNPRLDYAIVGDLNSNYDEASSIEQRHNDTNGVTGINNVLNAQGDEALLLAAASAKYNLLFEVNRAARRSHDGGMQFGWSSFDHIIVGNGVYDQQGITYVDNSLSIAAPDMPFLRFLFNQEGGLNRWKAQREGQTYTRHSVGGYADHAPVFARFFVPRVMSPNPIRLVRPGRPD